MIANEVMGKLPQRWSLRTTTLLLTLAAAPLTASAHHSKEPQAFRGVLADAERAYDRRQYERAEDGLRTALGLATQKHNQVYIRFRLAQTLRRLGRFLQARNAYLRLASDFPTDPKAPRALYEAARLLERRLGAPERARTELGAILRRYPRSGPATRALWRISRSLGAKAPRKAIAYLKRVYRRYRPSLGAQAAYLAAGLHERRLESPQEAIALYALITRRFPKHGLWDDAHWRAANLLRKQKLPQRALHHLRAITATRRQSWSIGSYNSSYLDRAALMVARIYLDDLSDAARGVEILRDFITSYPHSLRRMEARKLLVGALLKLGRRSEAEAAFAELKRLHPDSRYTRLARTLLHGGEKRR